MIDHLVDHLFSTKEDRPLVGLERAKARIGTRREAWRHRLIRNERSPTSSCPRCDEPSPECGTPRWITQVKKCNTASLCIVGQLEGCPGSVEDGAGKRTVPSSGINPRELVGSNLQEFVVKARIIGRPQQREHVAFLCDLHP